MEELDLLISRFGDPTVENRGGTLHIGGCSAVELAKVFGTPLYVYDEARIRSNYRRILTAFRSHYANFSLYYAVKANNNTAILRILESEGSGADVSGPAEIYLAKKAGFPPERILYSGNYHSDEELMLAVRGKMKLNLDSMAQLERIMELGLRPKSISFRINPGLGGSGHEGLVFAGPDVKFGIPEAEAVSAYKAARDYGIKKFGVHMMTGSNILDAGYFASVTGRLMDIVGKIVSGAGAEISFIDIGGGLGIPYRPDDKPLDLDAVARKVTEIFTKKSEALGLGNVSLMMEPGRFIVGDAGFLLARVNSVKRAGKTFIGTDAGMNTLLRPALYDAYHPVLLANRLGAKCEETATVVGQICENTDRIAKDRLLPIMGRGDLVALFNAGAYGFAMSSQYNTRPRAAEVLVNQGKAELIRERETERDIDRRVVIPARLSR
ncbi:MAG TPA: diaminopimelate decarboxylase [Candidatus Bilamarchaeum sp.]|nr:diaminopimelate decarboxylase [Candidatus Bilamarchaeum sp.]